MHNKRKHSRSSSVFKGVCYNRQTRKWYARCRCQGHGPLLGPFDTEVEAARAYDRQAVERFGDFARLNFPNEWPPEHRAQVYAERQEKGDEAPGARGERSEYRLQAGKISPTRVNAGLPTPDPQAPGRSARAKGKRRKVESKSGKPRRARGTRRDAA